MNLRIPSFGGQPWLILAWVVFTPGTIHAQADQCLANRYCEDYLFETSQIEVDTNVPYAEVTHYFTGQTMTLMMDVYYPDTLTDTQSERPVIILMHGGSFAFGNKAGAEMVEACTDFARRGFVAVSLQYRLGWGCDPSNVLALCQNPLCFCPLCDPVNLKKAVYMAVQDARAGYRFIYDHANDWHIDTDWMFAGGNSAGSITTLQAVFWNQTEADSWAPPGFSSEVGGLDDSGNDLPAAYEIKSVLNNCGAVVNLQDMDNNPFIPIISFHDSGDVVVPYAVGQVMSFPCAIYFYASGSSSIHAHRISQGMCSELHTTEQINHCGYPSYDLLPRASCFLKRVMCGVCTVYSTSQGPGGPFQPLHCSELAATGVGLAGCTYNQASNYNPLAILDDGSCTFLPNSCPSDINEDGWVNVSDLLLFVSDFGDQCQ